MKLKKLFRDFGYVISSNALTLLISTMVIVIVPKLIGVKEYGYWQLFTFYSSYLGLLPFGWLDGIYLRYGGERYENLDKKLFFSQFVMLMLLQVVFATAFIIVGLFVHNEYFFFIINSLAVYLVILVAQSFFKFILQLTNRMREFSIIMILANFFYITIVIFQLLKDIHDFRSLIGAFIIGNLIATLYGAFVLRDIFISGFRHFNWSFGEAFANIRVGIQLLISNLAAMLIIGVVRIGIQRGWGIETFGKVSLTLSISNLLMVFINAISLVLFPKFRRIKRNKLNELYPIIRDLLMPIIFVGILFYFPISYFIPIWLPKYSSALIYMSILFPMIAYQAKFEILSNTFLKVLRMEKQLLVINVATLCFSILMTIISVFFLHSLTFTIFTIVIVMAIRSTISELYVKSKLNVRFSFELLLESIMVALFIFLTWYLPVTEALVAYILVLTMYLLIKKHDIFSAIKAAQSM